MMSTDREAPPGIRDQRIAAIVLAGGRSSRLGQPKPLALVGGESLLSSSLRAVGGFPAVVVGPPELDDVMIGRENVFLTRESPPFAGPVAGIAAGYALLETFDPAPQWLLLLACDLPRAPEAVRLLLAALPELDDGAPGVCLEAGGRPQWLCGIYRADRVREGVERLRLTGGVDAAPVRALLGSLALRLIAGADDIAFDIDTPGDLLAANERTSS